MLFEVFDKFLFDLIHFIDLWSPFVELLSQNVDDTVAVDVSNVVLDANLAKEAIMFNAKMSAIFFIVIAWTGVWKLEFLSIFILIIKLLVSSMVDQMSLMKCHDLLLSWLLICLLFIVVLQWTWFRQWILAFRVNRHPILNGKNLRAIWGLQGLIEGVGRLLYIFVHIRYQTQK